MPPAGPKSKYVRHEKSLPKHDNPSSAQSIIKAPFVPSAPRERPGWKGVGFQKPKKRNPPKVDSAPKNAAKVLEVKSSEQGQQKLLNVVRQTFTSFLDRDYDEINGILAYVRTGIKEAVTEEMNTKLWSEAQTREAYVARWAPVRGLIFAALLQELDKDMLIRRQDGDEKVAQIVSIGGGPSEMLGSALLQHSLSPQGGRTALMIVDGTPWRTEIGALGDGLCTEPQLSKYASAAARAAAVPFIFPKELSITFHERNILSDWTGDELRGILGASPSVITLFFALNDLRQSLAKTTKFLLALAASASPGSVLLVVGESDPEELQPDMRKYPLKFLLDLTILGKGIAKDNGNGESDDESKEDAGNRWERIAGEGERRMFEPSEALKYPLGIGKVGLQVHLFRRL